MNNLNRLNEKKKEKCLYSNETLCRNYKTIGGGEAFAGNFEVLNKRILATF